MLTDPLVIGAVVNGGGGGAHTFTGASTATMELQDLATDGSTRIGTMPLQGGAASKCKMSISRSQSNENKPVVSDRTLIRLDCVRTHAVTGKPITMTAYVVTSLPQGGAPFDPTDQVALVRTLACFLLKGETDQTHVTAIETAASLMDDEGNTLARILGGVA